MTLQIQSPYIHVSDSNGNPYVGATLAVYQAGTTTYADIYSDDGLSSALPNPLSGIYASDANGNFPRVYIAAGTYKLRAETSAGVLIFQEDDIDTGLSAGTGALPISRGGTGATTAAAARSNLDVPSNSELSALSSQIATLTSQLQGIVAAPQGYLTLTSGTPYITGDVTAATAVYYTPYVGGLCPIYDGSQFNPEAFTELTLTLNANHLASTIVDAFVFKSSGVVTLGTGPAWNNSAAGAGSRGTGGGTTELEKYKGIWVNKNSISLRNGATLYTIAARQATYVGSLFFDGTNGQISCHRSIGQSRKWGVWNCYNRQPIVLRVTDTTASWSYNSATIRQSRATAGNTAAVFMGLQEERYSVVFRQHIEIANGNQTAGILIGVDSTTVRSGRRSTVGTNTGVLAVEVGAEYTATAGLLGMSAINCLEAGDAAAATNFYGGEDDMVLSLEWRG